MLRPLLLDRSRGHRASRGLWASFHRGISLLLCIVNSLKSCKGVIKRRSLRVVDQNPLLLCAYGWNDHRQILQNQTPCMRCMGASRAPTVCIGSLRRTRCPRSQVPPPEWGLLPLAPPPCEEFPPSA